MTRPISFPALGLLVAALFTCALASSPAQQVLDGLAAVVNGDTITFSQVRDIVSEREQAIRQAYHGPDLMEKIKEIRLAALNDLIDRQLILQEFKTKGFSMPNYVVEDRVNQIIRTDFGGNRQAFMRTLNAQGLTIDQFRLKQQEQVIVQAMRGQAVKNELMVPPQAVNEYYRAHLAEYSTQAEIKLRMIVLRDDANGAGDKRQMAEEIRKKILDGGQFDQLAQMYSEDSSQSSGGDWGWVDRKTLNDELATVAFNLKPGEVSKVVTFNGGHYLLYVEAKRPEVVKPLSEVRDTILRTIEQQQNQKQAQQWLAGLRKKAYIKIY